MSRRVSACRNDASVRARPRARPASDAPRHRKTALRLPTGSGVRETGGNSTSARVPPTPWGSCAARPRPRHRRGAEVGGEAGGAARTRTGDGGFADLCLATWRRRRQDGGAGGARRQPLAVTRRAGAAIRAWRGADRPRRRKMERETGFEPATSTMARSHSTTELFPLAPNAPSTVPQGEASLQGPCKTGRAPPRQRPAPGAGRGTPHCLARPAARRRGSDAGALVPLRPGRGLARPTARRRGSDRLRTRPRGKDAAARPAAGARHDRSPAPRHRGRQRRNGAAGGRRSMGAGRRSRSATGPAGPERVPNQRDVRRIAGAGLYGHDVEAARPRGPPCLRHVALRHRHDPPLLARRHRPERAAETAGRPRLDLDEHEHVAIPRDDVDFATTGPEPARKNGVPAAAQLSTSEIFPLPSQDVPDAVSA